MSDNLNMEKAHKNFNFVNLIETKRDGKGLSAEQIEEFVDRLVRNEIPDYQLAAFLMAIYFRGLALEETVALTLAMRNSGERLQFPDFAETVVDKHSTGGVGDKVSLVLVPMLIALGLKVPMISGRSLGITGGTLDKMESIPEVTVELSSEQIYNQVTEIGGVICGQTPMLVPADRIMYSLRDVTGTVPSIPLIIASIMSKKLAEGLSALVLDVKYGCGTFMKDLDSARQLAAQMVKVGKNCGVKTRAIISKMESPLGYSAGNWLEVKEVADVLNGKHVPDLCEITIELAALLLIETGKSENLESAREKAKQCLESKIPLKIWEKLISSQGANLEQYHKKLECDHTTRCVLEVNSEQEGFIAECSAETIGELIRELGGCRIMANSKIDHDVGVDMLKKTGEFVKIGDILGRVHYQNPAQTDFIRNRFLQAFKITKNQPQIQPLISNVI
ncbi:MAG: thymidine phosphorylase [Verrucomicrobiae bacterium]|nr:thymidine phosphorylase [Verrucomicrobiae bacterium]